MKAKIKNFLSKLLKNKKVNPILFPLVWMISQLVDSIRLKFTQLSLKSTDKKISIQLQSNGFVIINNF